MTQQHTSSSRRSILLVSGRVEFGQRSHREGHHTRQHAMHVPLAQLLKDQPATAIRTNYHSRKPTHNSQNGAHSPIQRPAIAYPYVLFSTSKWSKNGPLTRGVSHSTKMACIPPPLVWVCQRQRTPNMEGFSLHTNKCNLVGHAVVQYGTNLNQDINLVFPTQFLVTTRLSNCYILQTKIASTDPLDCPFVRFS